MKTRRYTEARIIRCPAGDCKANGREGRSCGRLKAVCRWSATVACSTERTCICRSALLRNSGEQRFGTFIPCAACLTDNAPGAFPSAKTIAAHGARLNIDRIKKKKSGHQSRRRDTADTIQPLPFHVSQSALPKGWYADSSPQPARHEGLPQSLRKPFKGVHGPRGGPTVTSSGFTDRAGYNAG
jgi:hypothetical protein